MRISDWSSDVCSSDLAADIERLKTNADINLSQGVSNRIIYLHMDQFREKSHFVTGTDKNPLLDARVRKAIFQAINREALVERVLAGVAIPPAYFLPQQLDRKRLRSGTEFSDRVGS